MKYFKTILLTLNLIGLCAVCLMQYRNLNHKMKNLNLAKEEIKEATNIWDKKTGRIFLKQDLKLTVNAYPLEIIIANLSQHDTTKYFTAYPVVKFVEGKLNKSDFEKVLPRIREVIIEVINQKNANDLLEKDGIPNLKKDLIKELNQINLPLKIENIYFLSAIVS